MIDLNDLAVFAAVVDAGGFTAAGRDLRVPKSNVSRRVARLEDRLGVQLLERTTRQVRVTEIGEVYYRHCKRIQEEAKDAETSVHLLSEAPRGLLRVGARVTTGRYLVSPIIAEFCARFPGVEVELVLSNRHIDPIEEGFDLVIRVGPLEDSNMIAKRLGESQMLLYASARYMTANQAPVKPADLTQHVCLAMAESHSAKQWRLGGPGASETVSIKPLVTVNDFPSLLQIVLDDGGIAVLPDYMCGELERSGQLARILPGWSLPPVEFYALYPSHRGATPKVREFVNLLSQRIGDLLHRK